VTTTSTSESRGRAADQLLLSSCGRRLVKKFSTKSVSATHSQLTVVKDLKRKVAKVTKISDILSFKP